MDENYPVDENDKTTWSFSSEWTSSTNILGLVVFRCSFLSLKDIALDRLPASPISSLVLKIRATNTKYFLP